MLLRVWNCSEGHNSFAVLHTCSQLTGERDAADEGGRTVGGGGRRSVWRRRRRRVEARERARHYASLGNLANDSIEAAGMSSMWT